MEAENNLLRVAAYIRVSTDSAEQENSYEVQEQYFRRTLKAHSGWISAGIYSDYGLSGTEYSRRMGYRRLLRHCKEGKIDHIMCKSISRFARNTLDFISALEVLKEHHVTIYFEKENLDTAEASKDFVLKVLAAISQEESRSISENIRWGFSKRYSRGEARNVEIYGYRFTGEVIETESGYRYKAVEIVEEEAAVVKRIFQEIADGSSYAETARRLNQDEIPAPDSSAAVTQGWTARDISQMIRLERYTGDLLLQKTFTSDHLTHRTRKNLGELPQYYVQNHHPEIIDRELYEKVQKIREINSRRYNRGGEQKPRAFSRCLICAECGRFFHVRNTKSRPIWFCPSSALNNGKIVCHSERIYEERIAYIFCRAIRKRFGRQMNFSTEADTFIRQMLARMKEFKRMDKFEKELFSLKNQLSSMENGMKSEKEINADKERKKEEIGKRIHGLERYLKELEEGFEWREKAIEWMEHLPSGHKGTACFFAEVTKEYVRAFALSITIYDTMHFSVHWFDDSWTEITADSSVGEESGTKEQGTKE